MEEKTPFESFIESVSGLPEPDCFLEDKKTLAEILCKFKGMFTPDFTLDPRLSQWLERFNIFRSRAIGQIVQKRGGIVIPTIGWSFRRSFDYCFCGLSEGGTVAIITNGVLNNYVSLRMFLEGVFELERRLRPEVIFIYGDKIELRTKARQIWHPNTQIVHLRKQGTQKHREL